jgi:asparagine synthase (glutamine-hydrolysing)
MPLRQWEITIVWGIKLQYQVSIQFKGAFMGTIAGVFYFDRRPVSSEERARTIRCSAGILRDASCFQAPGLLMFHESCSFARYGRPESIAADACTFDGRLHNRQDLAGQECHDGSLALAAYRSNGIPGLRTLIGDWSLALWDARNRAVLLASDYVGVRPLYYYHASDRLLWSSSLEHLASWTNAEEIDETYVADFLTTGRSGRSTPYRRLLPVPNASAVRITADGLAIEKYWEVPASLATRYPHEGDYEERLRDLFREAVHVRLTGHTTACVEYSGGLDSSSILCMARHESCSHNASLVGVNYCDAASTDQKYSAIVESACGVPVIRLNPREHPLAGTAANGKAAPTWWEPRLTELAKQMSLIGSQSLLTGQLGDLVMGNWLDDSEQVADYLATGEYQLALREGVAWARSLRVPIYPLLWRALWTPPSQAGGKSADSLSPRLRSIVKERRPRRPAWWRHVLPSRRKRLAALGELLESRFLTCPEPLSGCAYTHPYSHRPLVEFMMTIPSSITCRPDEPRRLMRRALAGIVPDQVLRRRSKGTYDAVFYRCLRPFAVTIRADIDHMRLVQAGFIDAGNIGDRLQRFLEGQECNESQLRQVILLEMWLRGRERRADATPSAADSMAIPA